MKTMRRIRSTTLTPWVLVLVTTACLEPQGPSQWIEDGENIYRLTGNVGIGTSACGQRLHIGDGNVLIEGGGETALIFKRDVVMTGGPSGDSPNPIFSLGRLQQAGDGDPEIRVLYSDDTTTERSVFEFDRKGIVASVKPDVGSHFEGFVKNATVDDSEPRFRLNSYPSMQLEMGPGGALPTDVAIRREVDGTMSVRTNDMERVRVGATDLTLNQIYLQLRTVSGGAPPGSDCNSVAHEGRVIVRIDGPPDLYVCRGVAGWVGK